MPELTPLRERWLERGNNLALKGTILVSPEGVNVALSGPVATVELFEREICSELRITPLTKHSFSEASAFKRYLIKIKPEIITLRAPHIDPNRETGKRLHPQELKAWLDQGKDVVLVDTRNTFEAKFGTFHDAVVFDEFQSFNQFPQMLDSLPAADQDKPVVMFCTGGIRCEKATALAMTKGFRHVYQLEGGILKYFEDCGAAHYDGNCFVFDERIAVDPELKAVKGISRELLAGASIKPTDAGEGEAEE